METVAPAVPVPPQTRRYHSDPNAREIAAMLTDLFWPGVTQEIAERLKGNTLAQRIAAASEGLT